MALSHLMHTWYALPECTMPMKSAADWPIACGRM
jgi:hypothetical protein